MKESTRTTWDFIFGAAQTLIFLFMAWSIWQTKEALDISRRQLEETVEPVIDLEYVTPGTNGLMTLGIVNRGAIAVSDIGIHGVLHVVYSNDWRTMKSSYADMDDKPPLYAGEFKSGMKTNCSLEPYLHAYDPVNHCDPVVINRTNEVEVIGFIVRYRRAVDMKPYGRLLVGVYAGRQAPPFAALAPLEPHITSGPRGVLGQRDEPFNRVPREIEQKFEEIGVGDLITSPQIEPLH